MKTSDNLDDDTVARLLAADARSASARYASQGLSALLPRRANGTVLKPNTKFLKNLVRDADSHNAALRRKEDRERVLRLRNLDSTHSRQPFRNEEPRRSRNEDSEARPNKRQRRDGDRAATRKISRDGKRHSHRQKTSSDRSQSRSPSRDLNEYRRHSGSSKKYRNEERVSRLEASRRDLGYSHQSTSNLSGRHRIARSDSSDPLEDLVGPLPAKEDAPASAGPARGTGALKQSKSVMDRHFSSRYDPSLDIDPESVDPKDEDDWDMALEALRDRQQWQRNQTDRMKAAGFDDEEIRQWQSSEKEKSAGDIRWRKAGEGREWDKGKAELREEQGGPTKWKNRA